MRSTLALCAPLLLAILAFLGGCTALREQSSDVSAETSQPAAEAAAQRKKSHALWNRIDALQARSSGQETGSPPLVPNPSWVMLEKDQQVYMWVDEDGIVTRAKLKTGTGDPKTDAVLIKGLVGRRYDSPRRWREAKMPILGVMRPQPGAAHVGYYVRAVAALLSSVSQVDRASAAAKFSGRSIIPVGISVSVWINADGGVTRVRLDKGSGDAAVDAALSQAMMTLKLQPPPAGMPMPIRFHGAGKPLSREDQRSRQEMNRARMP